jgi:hypothetical protein
MLDIRNLDRDHGFAIWNQTQLLDWRGVVRPPAMARIIEIARPLVDAGQLTTTLSVVERDSPMPDGMARQELARWSREICARQKLAIIVPEGGGFRAAAVRGVGVALTTLLPHRVPFKFLGSLEDAVSLLAPHLPLAGNAPAELRDAIAELRRRVAAQ